MESKVIEQEVKKLAATAGQMDNRQQLLLQSLLSYRYTPYLKEAGSMGEIDHFDNFYRSWFMPSMEQILACFFDNKLAKRVAKKLVDVEDKLTLFASRYGNSLNILAMQAVLCQLYAIKLIRTGQLIKDDWFVTFAIHTYILQQTSEKSEQGDEESRRLEASYIENEIRMLAEIVDFVKRKCPQKTRASGPLSEVVVKNGLELATSDLEVKKLVEVPAMQGTVS